MQLTPKGSFTDFVMAISENFLFKTNVDDGRMENDQKQAITDATEIENKIIISVFISIFILVDDWFC